MKIKQKPCKGTGKALGHGCNKPEFKRTYGLCNKCKKDWMLNTTQGGEHLSKVTLKASQGVKTRLEMVEKKKWKEQKVKAYKKENTGYLQDEINKLARKIDHYFNFKCIDCDEPYTGQIDAAHFHNVGSNVTLRFNLHNIHTARAHCNQHKDGSEHKRGYVKGLEKRYGKKYLEYVQGLPLEYPLIKLSAVEIHEKLKIVRNLIRKFDLYKTINRPRLTRSNFNRIIGIYK